MYVVVRLQGRRRARAVACDAKVTQPQLWHARPDAAPLPSRAARAIAATPVVNVNIDAGLLAGLIEAARQQPVPVIVQAETEELPR